MKKADPLATRSALLEILSWVDDSSLPQPSRQAIAQAVRLSARSLAQDAPGHSVEVRVPPFVAVQCIAGPEHTRGTPPNVVETDPRAWLQLATGRLSFHDALVQHRVESSGTRAGEIAGFLPVVRF